MNETRKRIKTYIDNWKSKGYGNDIPDEVPDELMRHNMAPSYKAIAMALLKNDMHMESLGFSAPISYWYGALKRIELAERENNSEKSDN